MLPRRLLSWTACAALPLCSVLSGCSATEPPIAKALHFLQRTQVQQDAQGLGHRDYAGDWPQYFFPGALPQLSVRDVSPFMPAFIHHALTFVTEANSQALELTAEDITAARDMRQKAVAFIKRFEAPLDAPDAGTYGFWPHDMRTRGGDSLLAQLALDLIGGPLLYGHYVPLNIGFYPTCLGTPTDCDDTAAAYLVLLNDAQVDGGPGTRRPFERFFTDWRDLGQVPRRINPDWLSPASGAYLTWFNCDEGGRSLLNDVDVAVNANVLLTLARYGRPDTPGTDEAVALINRVVQEDLYETRQDEVSPYTQHGYVFHFVVSRAFHEGPVPQLQPAADILADQVIQEAQMLPGNQVHWDRGAPHLDTALCLLTLMQTGKGADLIEGGIAYLIAEQNPFWGNWDEGTFFVARTDTGRSLNWVSKSFTTAMALEALCRYELMHNTNN